MAPTWKITLPSGNDYNMATINAGLYNSVAEILVDANWDDIQPTKGPRQLIAWVAILQASESDDGDVMKHLIEVMKMPMVDLIKMLQVSTDKE
jgi:hypothetical protein